MRPGQVELPNERGSHPKLRPVNLDLQIFLFCRFCKSNMHNMFMLMFISASNKLKNF